MTKQSGTMLPMKFLLLIYHCERTWSDMSFERREEVYEEYRRFIERIERSGSYRAALELLPTWTATCVRVRASQTFTADGAVRSDGEQLAGIFVIECRTLKEALEIAAQVPAAVSGSVELRPIRRLLVRNQARSRVLETPRMNAVHRLDDKIRL